MTILKSTASALAISFAATAASATTMVAVFDLSAPYHSSSYGNQGNSFTLSSGDLSATFSGNSFSSVGINNNTNTISSASVQQGNIYRWGSGAGVVNSSTDNSHTVDGSGWKDFVEVSFSQEVMMHEVEFSYFSAHQTIRKCKWTWWGKSCSHNVKDDDDFRWMYDTTGDGALGVGDYISANENANPFTQFGGVTSEVFGFGAFEHNDDWKLKEITVKYEHGVPAVPLPAAGWMLLAGLGGLTAMKRRKKA